jgi:hypothetical protein
MLRAKSKVLGLTLTLYDTCATPIPYVMERPFSVNELAVLEGRENATWRSVDTTVLRGNALLHLRPRTSCAFRSLSLLFITTLSPSPLFLSLPPRTYPKSWLPSTLLIELSHPLHRRTLQSPPHHLFLRRLPPSQQQNLAPHPHPMMTAPRPENGHART